MFRKHVIQQLSAHFHGELSAEESARIEAHLRDCAKCRSANEEIRLGASLASRLSPSAAPDFSWSELRKGSRVPDRRPIRRTVFAVAGLAFAAVLALVVFMMRGYVPEGAPSSPSWEVRGLAGTERIRPGEVLQTDSSSEAQIQIANIGQLNVDPNTRIRLLVTAPDEHRIALDRGKVEATTWAPPRLFVVETPSAIAVDLGCKYTLEVEDDGSSLLHVTLGLVALERDNRETIVPAGAFARTRSGSGPGAPFFEDASAEFQSALDKVNSLPNGTERTRQLEVVIREARVRDGLSLWHLIPSVDADSRGLIFARLARLLPPPPEVTREGIVALDPKTLEAWKPVISQLWQ